MLLWLPDVTLFMSSLERAVGSVTPLSWGLLLPQRAARTKGGTLCAVLSLALAFQSTRWTLGTTQARPQQSLCESPTGGIRVYLQRGENRLHPCISTLCATNLGAAARKQLTLVDVVLNHTALTQGEANFAPAANLKSVTALWTQLFPSPLSLSCFTPHQVPHSKQSLPEGTLSWSVSYCVFSLQHIQLVEVPGTHFVHLNEPEVVSGIISNFLTVQNARARL